MKRKDILPICDRCPNREKCDVDEKEKEKKVSCGNEELYIGLFPKQNNNQYGSR